MVDGIPVDLLHTGDRAIVDADTGTVDLPDLRERPVVSSFLERHGRILVVRRSDKVGAFPGKWSGISGFLEGSEDPQDRALREIQEETGLTDVTLASRGPVVLSRGGDTVYLIHPFRFHAPEGDVRLDWENVDYKWVLPAALPTLDSVPRLVVAYRATLE
jgi:8-oxo-dGTP pyrophosphatase MutT (NUDIX family)